MRIALGSAPSASASFALALPLFREDLDSRAGYVSVPDTLGQEIQTWIQRTRFKAGTEDFSYFRAATDQGLREVFLLGCGERDEFHSGILRKIGGRLAKESRRIGVAHLEIRIDHLQGRACEPSALRALATGLIEGGYQLRAKPQESDRLKEVFLAIPRSVDRTLAEQELLRGERVGCFINEVRPLANSPGNLATPRVVAREARSLARKHGLTVGVWNLPELRRERCRALLAVGHGSSEPPCLIRLTYPGRNRKLPPLVVVGKTITFDTGGISLKPGKNMEWMKFDKSGGMAVLAFMAMVGSVLKPERPVIGLLAAAENMPGDRATRPGDVIASRSGKTIEIVNTDAEGRLVLADALDVAQDFRPAAIIDLATLTGAASVALGRPASALLSNHSLLRDTLIESGEATGDRLWPLPLFPEYRRLLSSPFADLKNIGDGSAGTIVGGMFLQQFIRTKVPWAHIDLTSAWEERATAYGPAGATLFGVALLAHWIERGGLERITS